MPRSRSATGGGKDLSRVGAIVRTEARGEEAERLERELGLLLTGWEEALRGFAEDRSGAATDACASVLRDWLFPLPAAILATPSRIRDLATTEPRFGAAHLWADDRLAERLRAEADPFDAAGVHEGVAALADAEAPFAGGSLIVEATRALVAVDVNTGEDFSPAAGLRANLAAARDLPRQLRLRGLGGQIVVDFAPMPKSQRMQVEESLKRAFRDDPVETSLVGWTGLGLFELQRKRERRPLARVSAP